MFAASHNAPAALQHLMEFRAKLDVTDKNGHAPMHYGAKVGAKKCCAILLRGGANKKLRTLGDHRTPADLAMQNGHGPTHEIIQLFKEPEIFVKEIFDEMGLVD